jgi:outer membrane protein
LKKLSLLILLGLCLLGLAGNVAAAEARIGFVNTPRILEQAPQAKMARERLEQEFAPRDSELAAAQRTLKAQEEKLARDGAILSEEERRKLEREVLTQQRDLKRAREAFTEDLNLRRNEEFSRMQREVGDAIVAIAKQDGYDLIFETGVVYASDRVDLTERVLGLLRQQFETQNKKKTK